MKPKVKITVSEINKMNVISEEVGYSGMTNNIPEYLEKLNSSSLFEKFYDQVTNFLSNGKSFSPNELKAFR